MANDIEIRISSRDQSQPGFDAARFGLQRVSVAAEATRRATASLAEADRKLAAAQAEATAAAAALASEEGDAADAAQRAERAARELERATLAQAEAHGVAAAAANHQAAQERELARASRHAADESQRGFGLFRTLGTSATESVAKGLAKLDEMGPGAVGGIALAIAALPALSIAAGGAITLGIGGGLAAMAITAASKNAEVKKSFTDLKTHVGAEITSMSKPFEPVLVHIADLAGTAFDKLEPSLTRSLKSMAPAVDDFATQFANQLGRFGPTIDKVGEEFDLLLGALGDRAPAIMDNVASGIEGLVGAVSGHEDDFAGFVQGLTEIVAVGGKAAEGLAAAYDTVAGAKVLADAWGMIKHAVSGSGDEWEASSQASWDAQKSILASGEAMNLATMSAEALTRALSDLSGGQLSEREAARGFQEAIDEMSASLKKNGHTFDINTAAGRKNQTALDNIAARGIKLSDALQLVDKTGAASAAQMNKTRAAFIKAAEAGGVGHAAAVKLADAMGLVATRARKIPSKTETKVLGNIHDLQAKIEAAKAKLKTVPPSKQSAIRANIAQLEKQVAAAKAKLNGIRDKDITIRMNQVWSSSGAYIGGRGGGPGRAIGGVIGGAVGAAVGMATGGVARGESGGVLALVGEAGREIVRLPYGASVIPHGQTEQMVADGEFVPDGYATGGVARAKKPWGHGSQSSNPWSNTTYDPWGNAVVGKPKPKGPAVKPNTGAVAPHVPFWWHGAGTTSFGPGNARFSWGGPRPDDVPYMAPPAQAPAKDPWGKAEVSPGWGKDEVQGWVKEALSTHRTTIEINSGGSAMDDLVVSILRKAIRSRGGDVQLVLGK